MEDRCNLIHDWLHKIAEYADYSWIRKIGRICVVSNICSKDSDYSREGQVPTKRAFPVRLIPPSESMPGLNFEQNSQ